MKDHEQPSGDEPQLPSELDEGLAFAFGEESEPPVSPSVLQRIGEITGSKPQVLLRDDQSSDTAMLKPLGPEDRVEAGKYVVQGELGRGGVGTVHRGHDQDLGRDVAMKFLHERYKDDAAILHRFVEEAQIGGQLQHPGIVPVYDLGMVDGKPFFAMKLVKGQTLAKKLADRNSPADDRRAFLAIFEDICQTLAYAHARGVVHRDLKPANIMIGSFGEVQVVDWGMGKVLATGGVADEKFAAERQAEVSVIETVRSGGHGTQSLVGSVMGTPAYMPPEQARGDVDSMDERSDVFALGAILCEILTGQPPYVTESGDLGELIGMAAMAKLDDANARLLSCGVEPELVELTTRCLMPAPAARPRSAEIVAKTVHDHLAAVESRVHEARVEAAEAKVRAASLKSTQKLGIGLTTVIAAGLAFSLWFWREANTAAENEEFAKLAAVASAKEAQENERLATEQTEVAERELARALEIKSLITEMLESVTPEQAKDADITLLKGILDTASQRLAEGAIEDEWVAAELHALTGKVYQALGLYPEAELHLSVALELSQRVMGEEHSITIGSMRKLAILYFAQGRQAEAEPLLLQALDIGKRVFGEEHPIPVRAMCALAANYQAQGRHAEAERLYLQALNIGTRVLDPEGADNQAITISLARLYQAQGRYGEAEPLMLQTLEINKRKLGVEHPVTLVSMHSLADLRWDQGRHAEAESLMLKTLEIDRRVLGAEHPNTLEAMSELATQYHLQGRYGEAETLMLRTLEINERKLGAEHLITLASMYNLASHYHNLGRFVEAEPVILQTLDIAKRELGEEHLITMGAMDKLAFLYLVQGRYAEAESLYLETLQIERRVLGEEHRSTLGTISDLGLLYNQMERFEEAAEMYEASLPIKRRVLGMQDPWTGNALEGLVRAYVGLRRADEALPLQRELLELQTASADQEGADATTLNGAAWTLLTTEPESLQGPERALGYAERACRLAEESSTDGLWALLDTLALAQHRTGDTAAAVETQRRALALMPEGEDPGVVTRLAEYETVSGNK